MSQSPRRRFARGCARILQSRFAVAATDVPKSTETSFKFLFTQLINAIDGVDHVFKLFFRDLPEFVEPLIGGDESNFQPFGLLKQRIAGLAAHEASRLGLSSTNRVNSL